MLASLPIPHLVALAILGGAAISDVRSGHIHNELTLPPLLMAPLVYFAFAGPRMAALSALSAVACGFLPYLMFRKGAAGGGDVKLLAAIGAVAGASSGLETQFFGFSIAAIFSLCILTYRGRLLATLGNAIFLAIGPLMPRRFRRVAALDTMSTIRMGLPFFLGGVLAFLLRA